MRRWMLSSFLLVLLAAIGFVVIKENKHPPLDNSFETVFTMFGKPIKTLDRSFTRLIGVTIEDERALGDLLAKEYAHYAIKDHKALPYLNSLMKDMSDSYNPKELNFRVFVLRGGPNAFALPGGIIGVTTGLLEMLETEAQLVAILGHEKGHIDLGHCLDMMRVEAKNHTTQNGNFLRQYLNMFFRLNFSKTQETESDNYGFETLVSMDYEPFAMGQAHDKLLQAYGSSKINGLVQDYFKTHPSSKVREENWRERAARWHNFHPNKKMYQGKKNYSRQITRAQRDYPQEWAVRDSSSG